MLLCLFAYPHVKRVVSESCEPVISCRVCAFTLFPEIPLRVTNVEVPATTHASLFLLEHVEVPALEPNPKGDSVTDTRAKRLRMRKIFIFKMATNSCIAVLSVYVRLQNETKVREQTLKAGEICRLIFTRNSSRSGLAVIPTIAPNAGPKVLCGWLSRTYILLLYPTKQMVIPFAMTSAASASIQPLHVKSQRTLGDLGVCCCD